MKYIKPYNESLSNYEIESICDKYKIINYTINEDGSIDVNGTVFLSSSFINKNLTKLPIKFNKVFGSFLSHRNNFISLEGSPREVGGNFYCHGNNLTSLEGAPEKVGYNFDCSSNKLTSLEGLPERIGGLIDCHDNLLTSVRGIPEDFEGDLYIIDNPVSEIFAKIKNILDRYSIVDVDSKITQLLNEYDVISLDGKKIYRDNLEEVFDVLDIEIPKDIKFKNYEIH